MSEHSSQQSRPTSAVVTLAWLAVVVGVTGNAVASFADDALVLQLGLSTLTTVGVLTLVLNWLRRR